MLRHSILMLTLALSMACMALGVWWFTPEHAGRDLDQIGT